MPRDRVVAARAVLGGVFSIGWQRAASMNIVALLEGSSLKSWQTSHVKTVGGNERISSNLLDPSSSRRQNKSEPTAGHEAVRWERSTRALYLMLICFFSSAYSLYLYSYIQHGFNYFEEKLFSIYLKDYIILIMHVWPLIMLILNLGLMY